jgi:creatinine amidohydrolase
VTGAARHRLGEQARTAAADAARQALLLVPLGATEQHGPHLPVATDTILVELVAERAALALEGRVPVLVAPVLAFGSSAHHLPFGGTLSLATETYYRVLLDLGRSAAAGGFRRLFFLNGHGGNHELAQLAARDLALELPLAVGSGSWWAMAHRQLVAAGEGRVSNVPGHAGGFETAVMLSAARHLVGAILPRRTGWRAGPATFVADFRTEVPGSWQAMDGFSDSPADASPELGAALLEAAVQKVAEDLASFHQSTPERLDC